MIEVLRAYQHSTETLNATDDLIRRALQKLVQAQRKYLTFWSPLYRMPRAPYPLEERRNRLGRPYLAYEVHGADVYAELEGGGRDYSLQPARLEPLLRVEPQLLGYAPVVCGDDPRTEPLRQVVGHTLRKPSCIYEYQGGLMALYKLF